MTALTTLGLSPVGGEVGRIVLAAALGMFLGIEREGSQKSAGIRTFALLSLLGAVFTLVEVDSLLVVGGLLVIVHTDGCRRLPSRPHDSVRSIW